MAGFYEDVTTLAPEKDHLAEHVIELVGEKAYDECGEAAEDWPSPSKEAERELGVELGNVIDAWMKKHLKMPAWTSAWADPKTFPGEKAR